MTWEQIRAAFPDQWLVIEAFEARSENKRRIYDRMAVVEMCTDGRSTMKRHAVLHRKYPAREFCFVHTSNAELVIEEVVHIGFRGFREADLAT
jgi:hypothetical protein